MRLAFRLLSRLPLGWNHALGAFLGRLVAAWSPRFRRRTLENLRASGLAGSEDDVARLARESAEEAGKGATELAWCLFRPPEAVAGLVVERTGWEAVEQLRRDGRSAIFVTPHLGGYDVAGRFLVAHRQVLALYRPNKLDWLDALIREGRNRGAAPDGTNVAPATMAGVRMLLKHLKRGGCTFVLPDQVPGEGDGVWVPFFGRPAYTMTLVGRLQEISGAAVVFCFAERLPQGRGFRMHFEAPVDALPGDREASARFVNERVERLVRMRPGQFLWSYNRYKHPAGAPPPPGAAG